MPAPVQLAFHVRDLGETRDFLVGHLGATETARYASCVVVDLFGHRLSAHVGPPAPTEWTGRIGTLPVPVPHFTLSLSVPDWTTLAGRLEEYQTDFIIAPSVVDRGTPQEQWVMFFRDPSGNVIGLCAMTAAA